MASPPDQPVAAGSLGETVAFWEDENGEVVFECLFFGHPGLYDIHHNNLESL